MQLQCQHRCPDAPYLTSGCASQLQQKAYSCTASGAGEGAGHCQRQEMGVTVLRLCHIAVEHWLCIMSNVQSDLQQDGEVVRA